MSRIQVFTGFLTSLFTSIIKAFRGKFQPAVTLLLLDACVPWVCAFMQPRVSGLGLGLGLGKGLTVGRRMCIRVCVCVSVRACMYLHVCVCVCMCVWS